MPSATRSSRTSVESACFSPIGPSPDTSSPKQGANAAKRVSLQIKEAVNPFLHGNARNGGNHEFGRISLCTEEGGPQSATTSEFRLNSKGQVCGTHKSPFAQAILQQRYAHARRHSLESETGARGLESGRRLSLEQEAPKEARRSSLRSADPTLESILEIAGDVRRRPASLESRAKHPAMDRQGLEVDLGTRDAFRCLLETELQEFSRRICAYHERAVRVYAEHLYAARTPGNRGPSVEMRDASPFGRKGNHPHKVRGQQDMHERNSMESTNADHSESEARNSSKASDRGLLQDGRACSKDTRECPNDLRNSLHSPAEMLPAECSELPSYSPTQEQHPGSHQQSRSQSQEHNDPLPIDSDEGTDVGVCGFRLEANSNQADPQILPDERHQEFAESLTRACSEQELQQPLGEGQDQANCLPSPGLATAAPSADDAGHDTLSCPPLAAERDPGFAEGSAEQDEIASGGSARDAEEPSQMNSSRERAVSFQCLSVRDSMLSPQKQDLSRRPCHGHGSISQSAPANFATLGAHSSHELPGGLWNGDAGGAVQCAGRGRTVSGSLLEVPSARSSHAENIVSLSLSMASIDSDDANDSDDDGVFALLPEWTGFQMRNEGSFKPTISGGKWSVRFSGSPTKKSARSTPSSRKSLKKTHTFNVVPSVSSGSNEDPDGASCFLRPSCPFRIAWDAIGAFFVCFDCVFLPLILFPLEETRSLVALGWFIRIFWSFDVVVNFCTGYDLSDGTTEMRLKKIWQRYSRTWLALDLLVVIADWAEVFMATLTSVGALKSLRMGKMVKSVRMIRIFWIFRNLQNTENLSDLSRSLLEIFYSEKCMVLLGMLKTMLGVIWICHVFGCIWYGISVNSHDSYTWVKQFDLMSRTVGYRYVTAFHWSLSQFAGSMEVHPANSIERLYACCVLLVTFFLSAYVVSSLTSSMTRLEIATASDSVKVRALKQYLSDNKISRSLALRVQRNASHAAKKRKQLRTQGSIELLALVSESMRRELDYEIFMPKLEAHPLLSAYGSHFPGVVKQLCHKAVTELHLDQGEVVFVQGEVPPVPRMYLLVDGEVCYERFRREAAIIGAPRCFCEAELWTDWVHCGSMCIRSECKLVAMDSAQFQEILTGSFAQGIPACTYGGRFVKCLNGMDEEDLSDILELDFDALVNNAFPEEEDVMTESTSSLFQFFQKRPAMDRVSGALQRAR